MESARRQRCEHGAGRDTVSGDGKSRQRHTECHQSESDLLVGKLLRASESAPRCHQALQHPFAIKACPKHKQGHCPGRPGKGGQFALRQSNYGSEDKRRAEHEQQHAANTQTLPAPI